jgi:hypothetical protein
MTNPFDQAIDPDRHHIWQRLIVADTEAFVAGDFALIADDFDADRFEGIRCGHSANPNDWTIAFPAIDAYKTSWLAASRDFLAKKFRDCTHAQAIYRRCRIRRIDLAGDRALAFKEFSGEVPLVDGSTLSGERLTIYRLHRIGRRWKVVGVLGQLPLPEHL